MSGEFFDRLKLYYENVGEVLRGQADAASIFPNMTDIGTSRERVYAEFLRSHLPSCCNVMFGGFLFSLGGAESKQLDIIVTADCVPQYKFTNKEGDGKTFACIEGTLAIVCVKSDLTSAQLTNALDNIASIPDKQPLTPGQKPPNLNIPYYDDWPFKVIYASNGVSIETLMNSLVGYYQSNLVPITKSPNLIHIAGRYNVVRLIPGAKTIEGEEVQPNRFYPQEDKTDIWALTHVIDSIQEKASAARHISFSYRAISSRIVWQQ